MVREIWKTEIKATNQLIERERGSYVWFLGIGVSIEWIKSW